MKNFIIYNQKGEILRTGYCLPNTFYLQANENEFVMEGKANDVTQKITNAGIKGKVVDKTPQEIAEATVITGIKQLPFEKQTAHISNEQWQEVLGRLDALE